MTSKIMMNCLCIALFLLTSWGTVFANNQASSNYYMSKDVLSSGGGYANSLNYQLVSTMGQLATTVGLSTNTVVYAGFHQPLPSNTIPPNSVKLVAVANPSPICTGKSFDITLQTTPESNSVDGIELHLRFEPSKLQANAITNSGVLDDVFSENIDNAGGEIYFAAGVWDNEAPSGAFELVTVNFTVLAAANGTDLQVNLEKSAATFEGQSLLVLSQDETLITQDCMDCKVNLQGRPAIPPIHPHWETDLKIYVDNKAPYTIKTDGLGYCVLPEPFGDYSICVKGSHTLANRIGPPLVMGSDNRLDFGTLLEGDVDDNNKVNLLDHSYLKTSKDKCQGDNGYIANADLNVDTCVNTDDYNLFKTNFNKPKGDENPPVCESDMSVTPPMLRSGSRDNDLVTLRTTPILANLMEGTSFEVAIQVYATQAIDAAAAYLNFDPKLLQVNHLVAGETFDSVLENNFDNEQGEINFVAGAWDNELPKGIFTLVTINFTLLGKGGEQTLSFNTTAPRQTESVAGGKSVIATNQPGEVIIVRPASCQLYAVNDEKLNDSQFFTVSLDEKHEISKLGPLYKGHDIEALAIHPETNIIYAASGNNVIGNNLKGYLYLVDGETGELFPVGSTGFEEIGDLSFSSDGTLWAWAKGVGLITIDISTGIGTVEIASDLLVEGLTLTPEVVFGAVQTKLWRYDREANTLEVACTNLLGETEALEMMPDGLLLIGTHQVPLGLYALNALTCELILAEETLSNQFKDVEGLAMPVAACTQ
jgi:hypothetical protein